VLHRKLNAVEAQLAPTKVHILLRPKWLAVKPVPSVNRPRSAEKLLYIHVISYLPMGGVQPYITQSYHTIYTTLFSPNPCHFTLYPFTPFYSSFFVLFFFFSLSIIVHVISYRLPAGNS
jgi:hypothetical protein